MKKILVLGATSNIGYAFIKKYSKNYEVVATYRNTLPKELMAIKGAFFVNFSMHNKLKLPEIINDTKPDIIINTLANANVDNCELNRDSSYAINVQLVKDIVDIIKAKPIQLIHFSSNAIYDGEKSPYTEDDDANPVNFYGKCKKEADIYIKENLDDYLIFRPTAIIGKKESFQRSNPLDFVLSMLNESKQFKLVNSDKVNFIYVEDVVDILRESIENNLIGEYNIAGDKALTRYEFGAYICKFLNIKNDIESCTYSELGLYAKRGRSTALQSNKIKKALGFHFTPLKNVIANVSQNSQKRN
tara:strand:+ start:48033 stop:48938 length:906 start_codon:yes stop_codon:yes gene_type:complete